MSNLPETIPETHAALIARFVLVHPGSLRFDPATAKWLVNIEARGTAGATGPEWRLLNVCRDAVLLAERAAA